MKHIVVTIVGVGACVLCIVAALAFAYAKYRSAKIQDEEFAGAQRDPRAVTEVLAGRAAGGPLDAHMPAQIGNRVNTAAKERSEEERLLPTGKVITRPGTEMRRGA